MPPPISASVLLPSIPSSLYQVQIGGAVSLGCSLCPILPTFPRIAQGWAFLPSPSALAPSSQNRPLHLEKHRRLSPGAD